MPFKGSCLSNWASILVYIRTIIGDDEPQDVHSEPIL